MASQRGSTMFGTSVIALMVGICIVYGAFSVNTVKTSLAGESKSGLTKPRLLATTPGTVVTLKPLEKNQLIKLSVQPGTYYSLAFDADINDFHVEGNDLFLELMNGGTYQLLGFVLAVYADNPPGLILQNGIEISAALVEALKGMNDESQMETAAGSMGGGEVFGGLQVISWLLDRLDIVSVAQAQSAAPALLAINPVLAQLLAQFQIKRQQDLLASAKQYETLTKGYIDEMEDWENAGQGARTDTDLARNFHLNAQLEVSKGTYEMLLLVDKHQDKFVDRLEKSDYPKWTAVPPSSMAQLSEKIGQDNDAKSRARRYFRQRKFALEALSLIEKLQAVVAQIAEAYGQQMNIGQRSPAEYFAIEDLVYKTRTRQIQHLYLLKEAEAQLQSAAGALSPDYIRRPGWQ